MQAVAWADVGLLVKAIGTGFVFGSARAASSLPQAVGGMENAQLVQAVVRGDAALSRLTFAQRVNAAAFYRGAAARTTGLLKEQTAAYNIARARYLEGTGPAPGRTIYDFMRNQG